MSQVGLSSLRAAGGAVVGGSSTAQPGPPPLPPLLSRSMSGSGYFGLTPAKPSGISGAGAGGAQASRLLWRGALGLTDGSVLDGLAFVSHLAFPGTGVRTGGASPAGSGGFGTPPAAATFNPFSPSSARSQGQQPEQTTPTASALPSQDPDLGLSLALESLRGRSAVQFRGRVALSSTPDHAAADLPGPKIEGNGGVRLYVDPACPALYSFLYRQLLLLPAPDATSASSAPKAGIGAASSPVLDDRGRSLTGVLVSLGDESIGDAPLVIYALEATEDRPGMILGRPQRTLGLHVGIYHAPPVPMTVSPAGPSADGMLVRPPLGSGAASAPAVLSLTDGPGGSAGDSRRQSLDGRRSSSGRGSGARPDDPAPRRVPELKDVLARGKRQRGEITADLKHTNRLSPLDGTEAAGHIPAKRRAKLEQSQSIIAPARIGNGEAERMDGIESTDARTSSTPAEDDDEPATTDEAGEMKDDLVLPPAPAPSISSSTGGPGGPRKKSLYEADNKTTIKRVAMQALAERGLAKADGRFKDVWNMVSRGALYAFRDELAGRVLGMRDILSVVESHLDLYLRPASFEKGMT